MYGIIRVTFALYLEHFSIPSFRFFTFRCLSLLVISLSLKPANFADVVLSSEHSSSLTDSCVHLEGLPSLVVLHFLLRPAADFLLLIEESVQRSTLGNMTLSVTNYVRNSRKCATGLKGQYVHFAQIR